jgi:predicted acetyltransferase
VTVEFRGITEAEVPAYLSRLGLAFHGARPNPELVRRRGLGMPLEDALGGFDAGRLVATAGVRWFHLTLPGGESLPMAGVTRVTVAPTHRRRGILRQLMRRQLDEFRERAIPLAGLHASEAPIYGRFGYGVATWHSDLDVVRAASAFRVPLAAPGRLEEIDLAQALDVLPAAYEAARLGQPGAPSLPPELWRSWLEHPDARGGGDLQCAVHRSESGVDGYALYSVRRRRPAGGTLQVRALIALSSQAYARLWRFCLDVDLVGRVVARGRRQFEPLLGLLADPRAANPRLEDGLWLRLVDVPGALSGRRYATDDRLVLEVEDPFCDWNRGRWELSGGPAGAECARTEREPDLSLDTSDLAACFLGGTRFQDLAAAGLLDAREPTLAARADAMFASTPAPWCPIHF